MNQDKNSYKRLPQQKFTMKTSFTVRRLFQSHFSEELVFFKEDLVHGLEEQQDPVMGDGKRQKCDVGESQLIPQRTQVSYADIIQVELEGLEDGHWENLCCLADITNVTNLSAVVL